METHPTKWEIVLNKTLQKVETSAKIVFKWLSNNHMVENTDNGNY